MQTRSFGAHVLSMRKEDIMRSEVLFVDDECEPRKLMKSIFAIKKIGIVVACDGEEALHIFKENPDQFRVVIADFKMPKMNGVELCAKLKEIKPDTFFILCSGSSEVDLSEVKVAFYSINPKPVDIPKLISCVEECLSL